MSVELCGGWIAASEAARTVALAREHGRPLDEADVRVAILCALRRYGAASCGHAQDESDETSVRRQLAAEFP